MKAFKTDLSIADEIQAVTDFVASEWGSIPNLKEAVTIIQQAAFHDGRVAFDALEVGSFISDILRRRQAIVQSLYEDDPHRKDYSPSYDALISALENISTSLSHYAEAGLNVDHKWDFTKQVRSAQIHADRVAPALKGAQPIHYAEHVAKYPDCDGVDSYDRATAQAKFHGSDVDSYRASGFVEQMSLHNLQYCDQRHGRPPQYMLASATYAHFSMIQERLITHQLKMAIDQLVDWDQPIHRFEMPLTQHNDNILLGLLLKNVTKPYSEQDFEEAVQSKIEFESKPREEQVAIMKANQASLLDSDDFLKEIDEEIANDRKSALVAIREVFGVKKTCDLDSPTP